MYKDKNEEVQTINGYLSHLDDPDPDPIQKPITKILKEEKRLLKINR